MKERKESERERKKKAEDKEVCPICQEVLHSLSNLNTRLLCCGKELHAKCFSDLLLTQSMTYKQKAQCIMCRAKCVDNGSVEDIARLRNWVEKGKGWAMCILASRYREGEGVIPSDKKMVQLLEMSANKGIAAAQYNLGNCHLYGIHGLVQSPKRAFSLFASAAEQGHAEGQSNLGMLYANGLGVDRSYAKAREWWTKAAAQGHEGAIGNLKMLTK